MDESSDYLEAGGHRVCHTIWPKILCRGDPQKHAVSVIAKARKTNDRRRNRVAATRDLPTIAFFRADGGTLQRDPERTGATQPKSSRFLAKRKPAHTHKEADTTPAHSIPPPLHHHYSIPPSLHRSTTITPSLHPSIPPSHHPSIPPSLQYSSTPVLQYSSTPVLLYSCTPVFCLSVDNRIFAIILISS
jgi:hypothetical protein